MVETPKGNIPYIPGRPRVPPLTAHLRAMRAIQAVSRHGSTARAAEAMHLSQPAVARAVLDFEKACGLALFVRGARGMSPTSPGAALAARIDTLFSPLSSAAAEAYAAEPISSRSTRASERFSSVITSSQLAALIAIAHGGTEAAAAATLGVSQPAIHTALRDLEQLLNIRLFFKLTSGTRLTPAGEAVLRRAKLAVAEISAMEQDIAGWTGERRGRVVVGMLPLSTSIFLPKAITALQRRYPDMEVQVVDGTYESLMQQLLCADIDAIAGALRKETPLHEVRQIHFFDDELVVIAGHRHPCLQSSAITLADLLQWPWVTPLPGTPADNAVENAFRQVGLPSPRRQLRANSPSMTRSLVAQGELLALASRGESLVDNHGGQVRIVPVKLPTARRKIGMTIRTMGQPTQELHLLIAECQQVSR